MHGVIVNAKNGNDGNDDDDVDGIIIIMKFSCKCKGNTRHHRTVHAKIKSISAAFNFTGNDINDTNSVISKIKISRNTSKLVVVSLVNL